MGKSIGIDLGTTNSVVAFKDASVRVIATGPNNEELCRSCVAMKKDTVVVGNAAYNNWKRYAPNIVVSAKRLMGASISDQQVVRMKENKDMYPYGIAKMSGGTEDSVVIILEGKEYTPEQVSSMILKQLKEDAATKLNDEVTHAVITVPAYFNEKQKTATRKAAELAGLKVQRLLAEPTAAAISYGADKMAADEDKIFLVYDFGGGTFDLSILVASGGTFIESGTSGDRWLGGDDIDRLLSEYVIEEAQKAHGLDIHELIEDLPEKKKHAFQGEFKLQVENAKKVLSQADKAMVLVTDILEDEDGEPVDIEVTITREKFESMIRPLVQRTIDLIDELLQKTGYPIETIDNILLVGGSSCIPLVKKMLTEKYGKEKILSSEKPMLAIAEGAAILSHSLGTEAECPHCGQLIPVGTQECPNCHQMVDAVATQVPAEEGGVTVSHTTKHKTFIEIRNDADETDYKEIIDENMPLPYETTHKFYTMVENQKIVAVKLYSDKENDEKERQGIGYFTISQNLPAHSELQFTFRLTEDETMAVKVRVPATGKTTNVVISRGALDSHCMEIISPTFDKIVNDSSLSNLKKVEFVEKLQKTIDAILNESPSPENKKWQEYEEAVKNAEMVAMAKEDRDPIQLTLAHILLENFGRFIDEEDKTAMKREMARIENSTSPIERSDAIEKLGKLDDDYGLFTHGFLLNISADVNSSKDPVTANRARTAFNQFMAAVNEGNYQRARDILSANEALIDKIRIEGPGSSDGINQ